MEAVRVKLFVSQRTQRKLPALLAFITVLLASCGGGSGDSATTPVSLSPAESVAGEQTNSIEQQPVDSDVGQSVDEVPDDIGSIPVIGENTPVEDAVTSTPDETTVDEDTPEDVGMIPVIGGESTEDTMEPDGDPDVITQVDLSLEENRSLRWSVALGTEEFTESNYPSAIQSIVEVSSLKPLIEMVEFIESVEEKIVQTNSAFQQLNLTEANWNRIHLCPDGGRALARIPEQDPDSNRVNLAYSFENCVMGDEAIGGLVNIEHRILLNADVPIRRSTYLLIGTVIVRSNGMQQSGSVSYTEEYSEDMQRVLAVGSGNYAEKPPNVDDTFDVFYGLATHESIAREELLVDREEVLGRRVTLNLTIFPIAEQSKTRTLQTANNNPLRSETQTSDYVTGQVNLLLDGFLAGRRLVMQADNGDLSTFDAFLFAQSDSVQSFVVPWDSDSAFNLHPLVQRNPF